ncbi:hypothetical protein ZWY2020_024086 [Hordeum vulgare]|nr:hypothetical protein ZWY2020_024086 [Hordeum vulgare]
MRAGRHHDGSAKLGSSSSQPPADQPSLRLAPRRRRQDRQRYIDAINRASPPTPSRPSAAEEASPLAARLKASEPAGLTEASTRNGHFGTQPSARPPDGGRSLWVVRLASLLVVELVGSAEASRRCSSILVGETLLKMIVSGSQVVPHDSMASSPDVPLGVDATSPLWEASSPHGSLSTPAVRHLVKQYGLNIDDIQGTGRDGRVLKEDVLNYAASKGLLQEPQ